SGQGGSATTARAPKPQTDKDKEKTRRPEDAETRERIRQETREQIKEAAEAGVILVPMPQVVVRPEVVVTPQPGQAPLPPRAQQPPQPRVAGPTPPAARPTETGRIDLDVKLPRYAELSAIEVRAGDLSVANVDGPVNIASGSS